MASPARRRREQRSWLQWVAIVGGTALVGAVALLLMRGAFRVGEDMLASVEDTRPLGRRLRPDEVRARTAEHVETTPAPSPLSCVTVSGTILYPLGVPSDERIELQLRSTGEPSTLIASCRVATGGAFRIDVQSSEREARVAMRARYLFLGAPVTVSLERSKFDLTLEPRLGACLHGRLLVDSGVAADRGEALRGSRLRLESLNEQTNESRGGTDAVLGPGLQFEFGGLDPSLAYALVPEHPSIAPSAETLLHVRAGELRQIDVRLRR